MIYFLDKKPFSTFDNFSIALKENLYLHCKEKFVLKALMFSLFQ